MCFTYVPVHRPNPVARILCVLRMLIWIALFLGLEPYVFHACSYSHILPFSWGSNPVRFTYIPVDCSSPGARALLSCSTYVPIDCPSPGARILYVSWGVSWTVSWGVLSVVSCGLSLGVPSIVGTVGLGSGSPPLASPRFGTESDLELELVESAARFNYDELCAIYAFRQLELNIQISSVRIRWPRASRSTTQ